MSYVPPSPGKMHFDEANNPARSKLFRVAKYQRWVLLSVLANVVALTVLMLSFFQVISMPPSAHVMFGYAGLAITTLMIVSAFQLSNQFYRDAIAVICALAMWLPGVSLIVLLIINQKATTYLKQQGIKVGLMGASRSQI